MPIETSMYSQTPAVKLDPAGAISAAQGVQNLQASRFDLVTKQVNSIRNVLGSLAQDPDVTPEKVQAAGSILVQQGMVHPQQLQTFMSDLQGKQGPALRGALSNYLATMMNAHENYINANGGGEGAASTGDGTILYRNSPRGGITQQGYVAARPSAEFNATPRPGPMQRGEDGQLYPTQETTGSAAAASGYVAPSVGINGPGVRNQLVAPTAPPARAPAANKLTGQPAAPAVPVAAPPAAAVTTTAASGAAPFGTLDRAAAPSPRIMGAAVGEADAAGIAGQASGKQFSADSDHAAKINERTFPLVKAVKMLDTLGKTGTGPGTEQFNQFKSLLQSAGLPGIDGDKIKNFDEAKKYLTDYVNRAGNSGTNDKLAAAFAGNPSVGISNAAASDVAKSAIALDRMRAAQVAEARRQNIPESRYSAWSAQWNATQDPRAYGVDIMGPAKTAALVANIKKSDPSGAAYSRFVKSLRAAHDSKLLSAGGE